MKRIVSVLLIISCLVSLSACAKRDGTEPTNKYEDSVALFCNLLVYDLKDIRGFAPDSFWDYMKNEEGFDINGEKEKANVALYIEKFRESTVADYGKGVKIKHKIVEDQYLNEVSIENKKTYLRENYGIEASRVNEVKRVTVEFTIKGGEKEITNTVDVLPVKIDGKWYVCTTSGYFYIHPYASAAMAY